MKNGIKYLVAGLVATGLAMSSSYANVTVAWGTASTTYLSDSGGAATDATQLAPGDLLEIGTWAVAPVGVTLATVNATLASFEVFGTGTINNGPGAFSLNSTALAAPLFNGQQIYLVAYNAAHTEAGIFYSTLASWTMPADGPTASTTIDPANLFGANDGVSGTLAAAGHVVWGGTAFDGSGGPGLSYSLLDTANIVVPEPSSVVLVVTGLLGLLGLRRRHS